MRERLIPFHPVPSRPVPSDPVPSRPIPSRPVPQAVAISLPVHMLERLEETPHDLPSCRLLAVFLCPVEAHRLGTSSCLQYALTAHDSTLMVSMYEQLQLALAASCADHCHVTAA